MICEPCLGNEGLRSPPRAPGSSSSGAGGIHSPMPQSLPQPISKLIGQVDDILKPKSDRQKFEWSEATTEIGLEGVVPMGPAEAAKLLKQYHWSVKSGTGKVWKCALCSKCPRQMRTRPYQNEVIIEQNGAAHDHSDGPNAGGGLNPVTREFLTDAYDKGFTTEAQLYLHIKVARDAKPVSLLPEGFAHPENSQLTSWINSFRKERSNNTKPNREIKFAHIEK